jgi:hypothetical protein
MASMSQMKRFVPLLLAITAIAGLTACGGGDSTSTETSSSATTGGQEAATGGSDGAAVETIVIRNGEPVGGVQELEYSAGDTVRFTVRSDVADEVHVHGYDLMKDVPAGGSVSFSFAAEIEGIFEVELEEQQEQIAELRINP